MSLNQHILVAILSIVNALGGAIQAISLNWWFFSFQSDSIGAYPILVISSGIYVIAFGIAFAYVWLRYYRGRIDLSSLFGFPNSFSDLVGAPLFTLICIGFNDAFNGVLTVTSAPPDRTPPILGTMMSGSLILYSLVLSKYYLKETKQFGRDAYIAVLLTMTSIYISIMPSINGADGIVGQEPTHQVYFWCFITLVAFFPGALYNAQQQKFVKESKSVVVEMKRVLREVLHTQHSLEEGKGLLPDTNSTDYWADVHFNIFTLLSGCVYQLVFMLFFFWIMLINVPSLNLKGTTMHDLASQLHDGFGCFLGGGQPSCQRGLNTLYGLIFSGAYFATYIASIYLNLINLPLSMISGQLQGPVSAIALLLIPSLDLNNTGAHAYSIIPALILQLAALAIYEMYRKEQADVAALQEETDIIGNANIQKITI